MTVLSATAIPGLVLLEPRRFGDSRGFFAETWNRRTFASLGLDVDFVQDNHSLSREAGTLRGLHYQAPPHAQAKLVRCGRGRLLDVAVDIRRGSSTYGMWVAEELSFENARQLYVPKGFLHGFVTLEPDTEIIYKCSDFYVPEAEGSVRWDSASLGIEWRLAVVPVLSPRDADAVDFDTFESPFSWSDMQ
ncbi:MAG: dTDP-4-dehydrorhamnose 3,5-epimerase [Salinarimonas sp.]|nr:dTDP-4-dehydrorhamnose 3,5-epimerase [Salinarimonas sp.]